MSDELTRAIKQLQVCCRIASICPVPGSRFRFKLGESHFTVPTIPPKGQDEAVLFLPMETAAGEGIIRRSWCNDLHHGGTFGHREDTLEPPELLEALMVSSVTAEREALNAVREQLRKEEQERVEEEVRRRFQVLQHFLSDDKK